MKSRPKAARDTSKADALINQSGDDPEVAQPVAQPAAQPKAKRRLGKSHPDNADYTKTMLYLQADLADEVNRRAFESKKYDRTDIVNQAIAAYLGSGFEFKEP